MATSPVRMQVAERLQELSGDQVKTLVVQWLLETDGDLEGFGESLNYFSSDVEWGEIDESGSFKPLSEAEMIQQSLASLKQYRETGRSFSHESIQEWANSLNEHDGLS